MEGKNELSALFSLLAPHFAALDRFLSQQIQNFEPEIRNLASYCLDTSGKRIRPALVFFSGWREGDPIPDELVRLAAVIEMVHLATLVHDDIMDAAELRRNRTTAAHAFGPNAAVLLGDALFAHAVYLAAQFPDSDVCLYVAQSTRRVCAGEIMQTLQEGHAERKLSEYQRIIDLKTAELFYTSCFLGSKLGGCPPDFVEAAAAFGRHLGIAYQIYDDLTDFFGEEKKIGKTLGTDLASGKSTLPLILLMERLPESEAKELREEMRTGDTSHIELRIGQMAKLGVFEDVSASILEEIDRAKALLLPFQADGRSRLLENMSDLLRNQLLALKS